MTIPRTFSPARIERACIVIARQMAQVRMPVIPLQILAMVLIMTSVILAIPAKVHLIYAGVVFLMAVLTEHVACHLALLAHRNTLYRGISFVLIRYLGYGLFFCALGINAYYSSGSRIYIFTALFSLFLWGYLAMLMARHAVSDSGDLARLLTTANLLSLAVKSRHWWDTALLGLSQNTRPILIPFLVLLFCATNLSALLYWLSLIAVVIILLSILRILKLDGTPAGREIFRSAISFLFYLAGLSILLILIARLPFTDLVDALQVVNIKDAWLILIPMTWVIPYAMALCVLLDNKVLFRDAMYTQLSGDAFNIITPLLGMGGEPYKARHLANFVPLEDSSRAIVQSRLIHALSGVVFTAIILTLTIITVDLSGYPGFALGLTVATVIMVVTSGLLLWVTMSRVPSRFTGLVLSKLKIVEEFRHDQLSWPKFWATMALKMIGRGGTYMELYFIFLVLDIAPKFADVVLVEAMIMVSVSLFFFVPQGLGVNEAGIVTAFNIAGYAAASGVVYGLIRRARMVVYALLGLFIYLLGKFSGYGKTRYRSPATH